MKPLTTLIEMMSLVTEGRRRRDYSAIHTTSIHKEITSQVGGHTVMFDVYAKRKTRTWDEPDTWTDPGYSEEIGTALPEDIELYPMTFDGKDFPDYADIHFPEFKTIEDGMHQASSIATSVAQAAARLAPDVEDGDILRLFTPELVHGMLVNIFNQLAKEYPESGTMEDDDEY